MAIFFNKRMENIANTITQKSLKEFQLTLDNKREIFKISH